MRIECDVNGVNWLVPCNVSTIETAGDPFVVKSDKGEFRSAALVNARRDRAATLFDEVTLCMLTGL